MTKLRHLIKRIPYTSQVYDFLNVLFFPSYAEDGMRVAKLAGFLGDEKFTKAYDASLKQAPELKVRWRAHVNQWAGFHAAKVDGDFVQCGVFKAFFPASIMDYIDFKSLSDRKFYLFDTFGGVVKEQVNIKEKAAYINEYHDTYEFVVDSFKEYDNVEIVRGIVPQSLSNVEITKVAFLSIDMNIVMPDRAALEHFWPKMSRGGIIIVDDYAMQKRHLQQESVNDFAASVGVKILTMPTGQGIIIKP